MYVHVLHSRFANETLFDAAVKFNDTIARYHLSGYLNLLKQCDVRKYVLKLDKIQK